MKALRQQREVVRVAVFAPLWTCFDYLWPAELAVPELGLRIHIPFGHGKRVGVVLACVQVENASNLKSVLDRLDELPCFDAARCRWLERASLYYLYPQGEMWEMALSWAAHGEKRRFRCVNAKGLADMDADLGLAFKTRAALSLTTISKRCQNTAPKWRTFQALSQGLLEEVVKTAEPLAIAAAKPLALRASQQQAVDLLQAHQGSFYPLLLFVCTGSGKTEVYLQAAAKCIAAGKSVLVLVPEIGLTPMWKQRLAERFQRIAIWHSGMGSPDKNRVRHHLAQTQILLGTRSALFLPLTNLGLIVVDEEHDSSFKQQDGVAYSARDMSLLLAQELKIPVILGSATPSLESWRQVQLGSMACVRLTERVFQQTAIQPEIIDMRGNHEVLSPTLLQRLEQVHARGEQSMLYLNRRGYSPALQCTACGYVPSCVLAACV